MKQNSNDEITLETLENQITLETLDHLIINTIKEIGYSKKKRLDKSSISILISILIKLWKIQN